MGMLGKASDSNLNNNDGILLVLECGLSSRDIKVVSLLLYFVPGTYLGSVRHPTPPCGNWGFNNKSPFYPLVPIHRIPTTTSLSHYA